jgi:peptide/nickel transport system substrate-binding protein
LKRHALAVALALGLAACGAQSDTPSSPSGGPGADAFRGGTLRIALLPPTQFVLDPQRFGFSDTVELHRCCLSRTLLSYNGRPTEDGGAELLPDLAAAPAEISADGLTWTFRLKPDIRYGPPMEATSVKAADFIRAIQRSLSPGVFTEDSPFTFPDVEGTEAFLAGDADTISGLEAPDDLTLVVRLTTPSPDLGYMLSSANTAPIPAMPGNSGARLGVAEGHDPDFAPFLVATGPYMVEGSEALDFGKPPEQQVPVAGYRPPEYNENGDLTAAGSLTLVRNPSWEPERDLLRAAYADRIEVTIDAREQLDAYAAQVDEATIDLAVMPGTAPQAPREQIDRYQDDPLLRDSRLHINERDFVRIINMNLAAPPLDDVNVRRAISYAVDKAGMRDLQAGPVAGGIAGHLLFNSLEANLLRDYDAYPTPGGGGDLELARQHMSKSSYDSDGDGRCDDPACSALRTIHLENPLLAEKAALVAQNLDAIGIGLRLEAVTFAEFNELTSGPQSHIPLSILAWGLDTASGAADLFGSDAIESGFNLTLLGATPEQLRDWGYQVPEVPSVDDRIDNCRADVEPARTQCFADLDQYLMEEVVPWVPYLFENHIQPVSSRVVGYSFDQFAALPAFDRIAVSDPEGQGEGD